MNASSTREVPYRPLLNTVALGFPLTIVIGRLLPFVLEGSFVGQTALIDKSRLVASWVSQWSQIALLVLVATHLRGLIKARKLPSWLRWVCYTATVTELVLLAPAAAGRLTAAATIGGGVCSAFLLWAAAFHARERSFSPWLSLAFALVAIAEAARIASFQLLFLSASSDKISLFRAAGLTQSSAFVFATMALIGSTFWLISKRPVATLVAGSALAISVFASRWASSSAPAASLVRAMFRSLVPLYLPHIPFQLVVFVSVSPFLLSPLLSTLPRPHRTMGALVALTLLSLCHSDLSLFALASSFAALSILCTTSTSVSTGTADLSTVE